MFDIGFTELLVIGVVALVVVGPEQLRGLARSTGIWTGRVSRYVDDIKGRAGEEMRLEEFRRTQEAIQQEAARLASMVAPVSGAPEAGIEHLDHLDRMMQGLLLPEAGQGESVQPDGSASGTATPP